MLAKWHRSLGNHFALVSSSAGEEVFLLASAVVATGSEGQPTVVVEVLLCTPDLGSIDQQACPEK